MTHTDTGALRRAMDGRWEVVSVEKEDNGRYRVVYRSLDLSNITWSHRPFHPEIVPEVGTRGRIGFIGYTEEPTR